MAENDLKALLKKKDTLLELKSIRIHGCESVAKLAFFFKFFLKEIPVVKICPKIEQFCS